ncbi:MAG TPA: methionyl-tRNA formyltransferase [Desulfatiglandales bacterium]|nr:methionyl-tRNA formyltransferase [Desulfatiglandales bacterium]
MDNKNSSAQFPLRPRIIFMGTPQFAVPVLTSLIAGGYEILAVVTQPDRPKGRGQRLTSSPVKSVALENNLQLLQPEKLDNRFLDLVISLKPDLFVVVAFGQIIPGKALNSAKWGGINIHASLLPKYRGSAPIQWAIINNEKKTGLTTMFMDEGMDTGPILMQQELDILEGETAGWLHDRLSFLAPGLLVKTLEGLAEGTIERKKQDESLASYASKLQKEQGLINWSWPAERICGLIRGLDPWPGAYTYYEEKALKLFGCLIADNKQTFSAPGRIKGLTQNGLEIETGKGIIVVKEIQAAGKKRLPANEFLKGSKLETGDILGERE